MAWKKTISVDFDGVLHSYTSGWKGADVIPDPPVEGAFAWLLSVMGDDRFDPVIYSSRSNQPGGIEAMRAWFEREGFPKDRLAGLTFATDKPSAWMTLDDRGVLFEGTFPTLDYMADFKPWYKK